MKTGGWHLSHDRKPSSSACFALSRAYRLRSAIDWTEQHWARWYRCVSRLPMSRTLLSCASGPRGARSWFDRWARLHRIGPLAAAEVGGNRSDAGRMALDRAGRGFLPSRPGEQSHQDPRSRSTRGQPNRSPGKSAVNQSRLSDVCCRRSQWSSSSANTRALGYRAAGSTAIALMQIR